MRHSIVSDVFYIINNAENIGRGACTVPASLLVKNVLTAMQKSHYIGSFEFIDDGKSGSFRVELIGRINKSRAVNPRFAVKKGKYEKWESRYIPAKGFGILILSTSHGVMSQKEAQEKGLGGRLIGYVY